MPKNRLLVTFAIDFDAISGWLGTGQHPSNSTADYSSGYFSAHVGVPRLLTLFHKLSIADKITFAIPATASKLSQPRQKPSSTLARKSPSMATPMSALVK